MPRPRLCRLVGFQPRATYFKPAGARMIELKETILTVDEFEAVRLKDLAGLEQSECAEKMRVSQPTFHRLVSSARRKIADALVNGKALKIEGGNFEFAKPASLAGGVGSGVCCVCVSCGGRAPKKRGVPCASLKCPDCGAVMCRAGG